MKNVEITPKEKQFIDSLIRQLYAEPGFSDVDVKDMSKDTGMSIDSCKGVLGSLVFKKLVFTYNMECGRGINHDLIYLAECIYDYHKEWKGFSHVEQVNLTVKGEKDNSNCKILTTEKMKELIKKLKKSTTEQLVKKADKASGEELAAIVEVLKGRGQDVTKWETTDAGTAVPEAPAAADADKIREEFLAELDEFVEKVINESRTGIYNEIMKALGGSFDSDIEELYASASLAQIKDALAYKNILKPTEKAKTAAPKAPAAPKKATAPKAPVAKKVTSEEGGEEGGKNITIPKFSDSDEFELGCKIEFNVSGETLTGEIKRFYICHLTKKERCRIKGDNGKVYFKTSKDIKLV